MPKVGKLGLDMMFRTCTVQANLDFCLRSRHGGEVPRQPGAAADRDGAVRQFAVRRGQAQRLPLQPRPEIWTDTDPDRTGMLPFVFEPGIGFER